MTGGMAMVRASKKRKTGERADAGVAVDSAEL
jgi:hypothetical protein